MKQNVWKLFTLFAVLVIAITCVAGNVTAANSQAQVAENNSHLNIAVLVWMEGLDPAENWAGWTLTRAGVGETLVTVNENMEFVGQLADSWEQIDELTYKFHIRQGVTFSNGTPLTPEIVKASIERSVEINSRGESIKLAGIEVDGENIICTTTEPFSAFIANLTEPMFCIVDTTVDMSNYATQPIGTGPYIVTDYVSEEKIELKANENYWNGAPQIQTMTVRNIGSDTKVDGVLAGDLDIAQGPTATTLSRLEGNTDGIELVQATGTRENDMLLNCRENSPLSDVALRQALSYAVDRNILALIAGNGYATPLGTAFPSTVGYDSDKVNGQEYDVDKAKALLEENGYTDSDGDGFVEKDGEKMTLVISLSNTASTAISEALQDMWESVGIDIEIEMLENVNEKRNDGDFDIMVSSGWQTVNAGDGQKYLMERWHTDGTDNYGKYSSEAFDAVMAKLDTAFTAEERLAAFVEAQQVLADEVPCIWMYAQDNVTIVNANKVNNVTVFPIDYYLVTNQWTSPE